MLLAGPPLTDSIFMLSTENIIYVSPLGDNLLCNRKEDISLSLSLMCFSSPGHPILRMIRSDLMLISGRIEAERERERSGLTAEMQPSPVLTGSYLRARA